MPLTPITLGLESKNTSDFEKQGKYTGSANHH